MARLSVPLIGMLVLSMAATAAPPPAMASARHSATGNAAASCVTEAANLATARATARRCGVRVENLAARTERAQIFANPSGTQTFEATALPSRVKRPDGTWAPVDPTLREADGAIRPVATTATVKFSRGGTEPLATVGEGAQSWTLSWPQPLSRPRLEGEKAIYPNVFPGVDLVMRARVDGFTHVLVVHDAVAAANPALREVRYLTSGKEMMTRAAALMWDSTPGGLPSSAAEPGDGARRAEIPVRVEGNDFYLVPDQRMLNDEKTAYPVYIDPPFYQGFSHWAYSSDNDQNNSDGRAWVGRDPWWGTLYRSYFDFDVSYIAGSHVISASVGAVLSHSWSCYDTPLYLWRSQPVYSEPRSPWDSVWLLRYLDGVMAHAHKGWEACGEQPDQQMWFTGNVLDDVRTAVAQSWFFWSVGFCACPDGDPWAYTDELITDRWKKIHPSTVGLYIEYTSYPWLTGMGTTPGTPCITGAGRPIIGSATPQLWASMVDPDEGAVLQADFQYALSGGPWIAMPRTGGQASGLTHFVQLPNVSGQSYVTWRVSATDGIVSGPWSQTCEFSMDSVRPNPPVLDVSGLPAYPKKPPPNVKVGSAVAVPIAPGGGDTDIAGYWYAVGTSQQSPPRQSFVAAGANGAATLSVVPVVDANSANWLTVQAIDRAGNFSNEVVHLFRANKA